MANDKQKLKTGPVNKKIRKGDKVLAIAGNNRGSTGAVLSCIGDRVIVQGLNLRKRHTKGNKQQKGQIVTREQSIHISNVCLCDDEGNRLKLRTRTNKDGERELFYNKDNQEVFYRAVKSPKT